MFTKGFGGNGTSPEAAGEPRTVPLRRHRIVVFICLLSINNIEYQ